MDRMKKIIFGCLGLLFASCTPLFAQRFSIGGQPAVVAPAIQDGRIGNGWGLEVWGQAATGKKAAVQLTLGYNQLRGYDRSVAITEEAALPSGVFVRDRYARIQELEAWYCALTYVYQLGSSRWSVAGGPRLSGMLQANGAYEERNSINALFSFSSSRETSYSFGQEMLRGYDLGLQASLQFRVLEGYHLRAGVYQGLVNQWADLADNGPELFVTSLSAGLSITIK
jgi:hypothetical protein